jgi:hypothetical protein
MILHFTREQRFEFGHLLIFKLFVDSFTLQFSGFGRQYVAGFAGVFEPQL